MQLFAGHSLIVIQLNFSNPEPLNPGLRPMEEGGPHRGFGKPRDEGGPLR